MLKNRISHKLLMGIQTGTTILKSNLIISAEDENVHFYKPAIPPLDVYSKDAFMYVKMEACIKMLTALYITNFLSPSIGN